jgi:hypothetical protein
MKRGRLSSEEQAEINRLAETMANPTPGKIARRIDRNNSTVKWYMLTHGLIDMPVRYGPAPYTTKSGVTKRPFTPEEDARITELRVQCLVYRKIAEIVSKEFGPRTTHSVHVRLVMLGATTEAA